MVLTMSAILTMLVMLVMLVILTILGYQIMLGHRIKDRVKYELKKIQFFKFYTILTIYDN